MKKAICIISFILAAWLTYRTDIDFGRCLNDSGDGKIYNGEPFYNYTFYEDAEENDIILSFFLLDPLNNYCDDVIFRKDITLLKDAK